MAWKVEKWLAEVFPGESKIYDEYRHLPSRELVIVAAAVLDSALAELLSLRLRNNPKEIEEFLGLDEDGRAPVASFGARIQLALLLGLIAPDDAAILRVIKKLRNKFAHRVNITFLSAPIFALTSELLELWIRHWIKHTKGLAARLAVTSGIPPLHDTARVISASPEVLRTVFSKQQLKEVPEAGQGLLLAVFTVYHAYFHRLHGLVQRVDSWMKDDLSSGE